MVTTFVIIVHEVPVHWVPQFGLFDGAIGVAGPNTPGFIELKVHSASVHGGDDEIVPIYALCALEDDAIELVPEVGSIVDVSVEPQPDNSVTSVLEITRGLGWAVGSPWEVPAETETDTTPEPRKAGASLDSDMFGEAAHVAGA